MLASTTGAYKHKGPAAAAMTVAAAAMTAAVAWNSGLICIYLFLLSAVHCRCVLSMHDVDYKPVTEGNLHSGRHRKLRLSIIPLPENSNSPVLGTGVRGLTHHSGQRSHSPDDGIHLALLDVHGVRQEQGRLVMPLCGAVSEYCRWNFTTHLSPTPFFGDATFFGDAAFGAASGDAAIFG